MWQVDYAHSLRLEEFETRNLFRRGLKYSDRAFLYSRKLAITRFACLLHFCYTGWMPTLNTRINITADEDIEKALTRAARRDQMPVAAKAVELLRLALELEEDLLLTEIADARASKKVRFISHERAWV